MGLWIFKIIKRQVNFEFLKIVRRIVLTKTGISLFFFFQAAFTFGQKDNPNWCGYTRLIDNNSKVHNKADSSYLDAIGQINKLNKASFNNKIYQIQVVFHIIYNEEKQNIADSVIFSQLQILNNAFHNTDSLNVRKEFRGVKGDAKIQFVLANTDPNGKPTHGINRIKTWQKTFNTGDSLFMEEKVKFSNTGGVDAWNSDKYLNIWVCNLTPVQSGINLILGYAYPPVNAKYWDNGFYKEKNLQGVVIHYQVIGLNNPFKLLGYNTGINTLVHEIGHYLGLKHIWADNPNCSEDDFLGDTPQASKPTYYCDFNKNSCLKGTPNDLPDMIENYMDYSPEKCLQMFTQQQVSLMQYNLVVNRNQIFTVVLPDKQYHSGSRNIIVTLYPNPTQTYIYIEKILNSGTPEQKVNCQIIDMLGNSVISSKLETAVNKIDVAALSHGCYLIYIKFDHDMQVVRFVKI